MYELGSITCFGTSVVPSKWQSYVSRDVSRLYYIHGGVGGFTHKGKREDFVKGKLYFIPASVVVRLESDVCDPLVHSYCNFELIPPALCERVISLEGGTDAAVSAAISVFVELGRLFRAVNMNTADENDELTALGRSTVAFLVSRILSENGISRVEDATVLTALKMMHSELSEPLTTEKLAAACGMSVGGFIRRFSSVMGTTPYAYLKNLRLRTARFMRAAGQGVETVATAVGYADSASLLHALANDDRRVAEKKDLLTE